MRLSTNIMNVFDANGYEYNDFRTLAFDLARGTQAISKSEAEDKLREINFSILGLSEKPTNKEIRRAIRRHQTEVFEILEDQIEDHLVSGFGENPFFRQFVEEKYNSLGDTNEFWTDDDVILTVSELSGNHHSLYRQALGAGKSFSVKTSWYGIKIYAEYERYVTGRVDWASFVNKMYEAFDKKINEILYASVMAMGDNVQPNAQFVKTGALNADTRDEFMTLIEDVQMATGQEAVIMGTRSALSKLAGLGSVEWISEKMRDERHTTGRIALFEGIKLVEIPQVFADGDTSKKLVDNTKLLIMAGSDNKFVKLYHEGETEMFSTVDNVTHNDMTIDAEIQRKMGVATIVNKKFGVWNIA